jgi:CubicO group peptidase (beta-lactamase class C family)
MDQIQKSPARQRPLKVLLIPLLVLVLASWGFTPFQQPTMRPEEMVDKLAAGVIDEAKVAAGLLEAQPGEMTSHDLEIFLDEFFSRQMEELDIPGVAVVVVTNDGILFSKGYGYADIEAQIPVDPDRTIMRAGSVSKLVTATGAMQLVERGWLSLDADVNQFLHSLQVPYGPSDPVTLHQLLTHTAGFEDTPVGSLALDPEAYVPLHEYLLEKMPERVLEPSTIHSYSNYSFALIGQLIQDSSDMPFSEYIDENIFQPLGMTHSTFQQPLPSELIDDLAVGYLSTEKGLEPAGFVYDLEAPAGGLSTTAMDMARFMIAHLEDGQYEGTQILQQETAQMMHQQQFTHHEVLPGFGYGFKERFVNGERLIGHGGDIGTYSSQMILHLEDGWGLYLQYNVFNDALRERLIAAFMDRYYPAAAPENAPDTLVMSEEDLERFAGPYRWVKHSRSTIGKVVALIPGPVNVIISANADGTLSVSFFGADAEWRFAPVGPLMFKQVQGGVQQLSGLEFDLGDNLVFRETETGEITFAFVPLQSVALEKIPWYEGGEAQMGIFGMLLIIFLSPFFLWSIGALVTRIRKRESTTTRGSKRARRMALLVSGLGLVFMVTVFLGLGDPTLGIPLIIKIALAIPIVIIPLAIILLGRTIEVWVKAYWSVWGRIYYSLIAVAAIVLILFASYWNLLGWRF